MRDGRAEGEQGTRDQGLGTEDGVPSPWSLIPNPWYANFVQPSYARNIHNDLWFADAALDLQDQVGAARDEPARVAVLGKEFQRLSDGARGMIGVPHG